MQPLRPGDPETIGPYTILARLGSGGMGVVFLGEGEGNRVAVKVVRSSYLDDPSLRTRFQREIDIMRQISSPYVASFLNASSDDDTSWLATEFVNGPTLADLVASKGPLSEERWWALASEIRQALQAIHSRGIVHRDVKPSNIVVSEAGAKLIDFGISLHTDATSLTMTGVVVGSPAWLSLEHLEGKDITPGSDFFSAGSVLAFAAQGRSPWGAETNMTVLALCRRMLDDDFDLSGLSADQQSLVRALQRPQAPSRSFDFPERTPPYDSPETRMTGQTGSEESQEPAVDTVISTPASEANNSTHSPSRLVPALVGVGAVAAVIVASVALSPPPSEEASTPSMSSSESDVQSSSEPEDEPAVEENEPEAETELPMVEVFGPVTEFALEPSDSPVACAGEWGRVLHVIPGQGPSEFRFIDCTSENDEEVLSLRTWSLDSNSIVASRSFSSSRYLMMAFDSQFSMVSADDQENEQCVLIELGQLREVARWDRAVVQCFSAFSLDGQSLFFLDSEGYGEPASVKVVNLSNGQIERSYDAGPFPRTFAVTEDYLVAANRYDDRPTHGLIVVNLESGAVVAEFDVGKYPSGYSLSPDGQFLAFVASPPDGGDTDQVGILNLNTLELESVIDLPVDGGDGRKTDALNVAFTPDGALLVVPFGLREASQVAVIDMESRRTIQVLQADGRKALGISTDGQHVLAGDFDSLYLASRQ